MYRLTINIGVASAAASYEMAEGSGVLRLSPSAVDLPSARFLTADEVQAEPLAKTLRGAVDTARQQLGEEPASVQVTYPANWQPGQLLLLWEAVVLAGIPDAATQAAAEPKLSAPPASTDDEQAPARTTLLPAGATPRCGPAGSSLLQSPRSALG